MLLEIGNKMIGSFDTTNNIEIAWNNFTTESKVWHHGYFSPLMIRSRQFTQLASRLLRLFPSLLPRRQAFRQLEISLQSNRKTRQR
jgi:hypothetical protein